MNQHLTSLTAPLGANPALAALARRHAAAIADAVACALERMPKWQEEAGKHSGGRTEYLDMHFRVFAEYLAAYFDRGEVTFRHLFLGEIIKALYEPDSARKASEQLTVLILADLRARIEAIFAAVHTAASRLQLSNFLDAVAATINTPGSRKQRILLIGDCLFLDIIPFVSAAVMDSGIRLEVDYATSKNPAVLRDEIRALADRKFDLVFFSPFTYEFSATFNQLLSWKNVLKGDAYVAEIVACAWQDARDTIDVVADLFDCPIYVHNTSAIVREENRAKRIVKSRATARMRTVARRLIDADLSAYVERKNTSTFLHLFVFDEQPLVDAIGEIDSGAYLYKSQLQHPAVLGRIFSEKYVDLLYVSAWLAKRKVLVCDLDNTVWDGVIGEGSVAHFHDRQATLKALKKKGVLLAINSKNDPANVHWRGGTLSEDDFVYSSISWEPKVRGMQRIQDALNLKIKDYVFIDDRADERELMAHSYPDTLCLDATDPTSWRRLALWDKTLEVDLEMDRTQMYKQREARKSFIKEDISTPEERAALFRSLGLRLSIQVATSGDLRRVAELINRTNQFNLEGSRTTFREVGAWYASPDHVILLGQTADRFGDMGTTCIAVAAIAAQEMRILPFVLSCRVFGYGIEHAVMNHVKLIAKQRGVARIVANFVATSQNAPCANFLAESGFTGVGTSWAFDVATGALQPPAPWLEVTVA